MSICKITALQLGTKTLGKTPIVLGSATAAACAGLIAAASAAYAGTVSEACEVVSANVWACEGVQRCR